MATGCGPVREEGRVTDESINEVRCPHCGEEVILFEVMARNGLCTNCGKFIDFEAHEGTIRRE
jgi:hypothetical protein